MDNQGAARMWDCDSNVSQDPPPLRRPNISSNVANNPQTCEDLPEQLNNELHISYQEENNFVNQVRNSKLSAEAKEFYPANCSYSIQQRLTRFRISEPSPEHSVSEVKQDVDIDIARLKEILNSLTYDPGKFDELLESFIDILAPYFEDISMITNTTEMILEQVSLYIT